MAATADERQIENMTAGLRRWSSVSDPHIQAAVELIIDGGWLRFKAFRRYVEKDSSDNSCWMRWDILRKAFDADEFIQYGGSHARAVLDFAIDLLSNRYKLFTMDAESGRRMVKPLADALGVTVTIG